MTERRASEQEAAEYSAATLIDANRQLTELLACDSAPLTSDQGGAECDGLVLCGIVGAKDVGKSCLINAIADAPISVDEGEVSEGTYGAVCYVHRDAEAALRERLGSGGVQVERIVQHDSDAIRNLVLLDLPDISSTFVDHLDVVRAVVPKLDRLIWLWDPIVAGDRSYAERLGRVVKDQENLYFVLNKVDLLLRDEAEPEILPSQLWESWMTWFRSMADLELEQGRNGNGLNGHDGRSGSTDFENRCFLLSARWTTEEVFTDEIARSWDDPGWTTNEAIRPLVNDVASRAHSELVDLRKTLLSPLTDTDVSRIKQANVRAQFDSDREMLRTWFDLDRVGAAAAEAETIVDQEIEHTFDERFVQTASRRLARRGRAEADIAHHVLAQRLEHWPILPTVFWAAGGIVRWAGKRISGADESRIALETAVRVDGVTLPDRIDLYRSRVQSRTTEFVATLREPPALPEAPDLAKQVQARLTEVAEEADEQILAQCVNRRSPPGAVARGLVWFILLWFPLVQPIAYGLLVAPTGGTLTAVKGAAIVVAAFGARSVLVGLAVVLLIYILWLAAMFARAVRDVREIRGVNSGLFTDETVEQGGGAYARSLVEVIADEVRVPVGTPLLERAERVVRIRGELSEPVTG